MENKKQTAIEWLVQYWKKLQQEGEKMCWNQMIEISELTKDMYKEQLGDAWNHAAIDASYGNKYKSFEHFYNVIYEK